MIIFHSLGRKWNLLPPFYFLFMSRFYFVCSLILWDFLMMKCSWFNTSSYQDFLELAMSEEFGVCLQQHKSAFEHGVLSSGIVCSGLHWPTLPAPSSIFTYVAARPCRANGCVSVWTSLSEVHPSLPLRVRNVKALPFPAALGNGFSSSLHSTAGIRWELFTPCQSRIFTYMTLAFSNPS